jgi:hypothetical protein
MGEVDRPGSGNSRPGQNRRPVEAPMTELKRCPVHLRVRVSGEMTRFSGPTLVEAYARLVPPAQRGCRSPGSDATDPWERPARQDPSRRPARR